MKVPFLDLRAQHAPMMEQIHEAIHAVIESGIFAGGPVVTEFEAEFANYCECRHAVGVGNGTDALWLSLLASGVGEGDEVITVPHTFVATVEAISRCGAKPVFVDIDPLTYTMDPALLESAITANTKAVVPVHILGHPVDMDSVLSVAKKHGLVVIEDACQAHGATYKNRRVGSLGTAGCFSFYPGKNLGALGEAGAVVTNDDALASRLRVLREHGQTSKYYHTVIGWNCRMDAIQASVLRVKLRNLESVNERRRDHAAAYHALLGNQPGVDLPYASPNVRHVYHVYAIRVRDRDFVMRKLTEAEIGCSIHYPIPVHLQEAYRFLGLPPGSFPVAERTALQFLSLPMYAEIPAHHLEYVAHKVRAAVGAAVINGAKLPAARVA